MPLYEYECTECGERTELIQRMADPPLADCPKCGKPVRKLLSAPSFQFKGSGWYVTDYAGKTSGNTKTDEGSTATEKPAATEKPTATEKPAAKKDNGGKSES